MDYAKKTRKIEEHLLNHPNDYQSVISYLINRSKYFEQKRYLKMIERKKKVAQYRREMSHGK